MIVESGCILDYRLIALLPTSARNALDGLFDLWPDTAARFLKHL